MNMFISNLLSAWTVFVAVVFFGVVWWAFSGARKTEFEAAARLPLEDDDSDRIPNHHHLSKQEGSRG
jgi:cytochrome c oxidase cbb3-type subunit IV